MNVMDLMMLMIVALIVGAFIKWLCERVWN